jgi:hypothetical protein
MEAKYSVFLKFLNKLYNFYLQHGGSVQTKFKYDGQTYYVVRHLDKFWLATGGAPAKQIILKTSETVVPDLVYCINSQFKMQYTVNIQNHWPGVCLCKLYENELNTASKLQNLEKIRSQVGLYVLYMCPYGIPQNVADMFVRTLLYLEYDGGELKVKISATSIRIALSCRQYRIMHGDPVFDFTKIIRTDWIYSFNVTAIQLYEAAVKLLIKSGDTRMIEFITYLRDYCN